jgi:hypothetical protein
VSQQPQAVQYPPTFWYVASEGSSRWLGLYPDQVPPVIGAHMEPPLLPKPAKKRQDNQAPAAELTV